ncbi:MAG: type II secretion system minor pseudopilin GspH [Thiotrichaceae bacterium]
MNFIENQDHHVNPENQGSDFMTPQHAFTLIELMVVIVIIGIVLTFTTLSIGDGGKRQQLQQEAERFIALLSLASEEATMQAQELGVSFSATQYQFWRFQLPDWKRLIDDEILRQRNLPPGMILTVEIEGEKITLPETQDHSTQPMLLLLSSGEITPFTARFQMQTDAQLFYTVRGELTGEMTLQHEEK